MSLSLARSTLLYMPAQMFGPMFLFATTVIWTHLLDPGELWRRDFCRRRTGIDSPRRSHLVVDLRRQISRALRGRAEDSLSFDGRAHRRLQRGLASHDGGADAIVIGVSPSPGDISSRQPRFSRPGPRSATTANGPEPNIASASTPSRNWRRPIIGSALSILAVLAFGADAAVALAAMTVGQMIGLAAVMRGLRVWPRLGTFDAELFVQARRYGLPLLASGILSWIAVNGIRVDHRSEGRNCRRRNFLRGVGIGAASGGGARDAVHGRSISSGGSAIGRRATAMELFARSPSTAR